MKRDVSSVVGDSAAAVLGAAAFLASAIHVYSVCRDNGAEQIVAVLITLAVELLALVAMLELRSGFRWTPFIGLLVGVGLTGAANLATAQQNGPGWGWPETVAVAPAVLFLVVLAIVETRPAKPAVNESITQAEPVQDALPEPSVDQLVDAPALVLVEPTEPVQPRVQDAAVDKPAPRPRAVSTARVQHRRSTTARTSARSVPAHIAAIMDGEGVSRSRAYQIHKQRTEDGA